MPQSEQAESKQKQDSVAKWQQARNTQLCGTWCFLWLVSEDISVIAAELKFPNNKNNNFKNKEKSALLGFFLLLSRVIYVL